MTSRLASSRLAALALVTLFTPAALAQQSGSAIETDKIFQAIGVRDGTTVCEIGAGDGELSIAAAGLVGAKGRVYTSELGNDRVKGLQDKIASSGLSQLAVVSGDPARTNFPDAACDALFMRNVYHHFADPAAMDASIAAALKPGGRVAVIDFMPPGEEAARPADRARDGMHGVRPESVSRELKEAGLEPVSSETGDQRWFVVVAAKPKR